MSAEKPFDKPKNSGGDAPPTFDDALCAALCDVPVPAGLADRLIARLEAEAKPQVSTGEAAVPPSRPRRFSRRQIVITAGSISLAVLAAASVFFWRRTPRAVSRDELTLNAARWLNGLETKNWQPISTLPSAISIDSAVTAKARQWQTTHYATQSGWSASVTAIDLARPQGPQAVLFAIRSRARFDVPSSPTTTLRLGFSGGLSGTAWQRSSGVLYVLVVDAGRGQRLEDFLRSPAQA